MNRRETLALHRMAVMRQRARAANQRRLAEECQCPACTIKRAVASAIATGTAGAVRISAVDLLQPLDDSAPTDEPPKH